MLVFPGKDYNVSMSQEDFETLKNIAKTDPDLYEILIVSASSNKLGTEEFASIVKIAALLKENKKPTMIAKANQSD